MPGDEIVDGAKRLAFARFAGPQRRGAKQPDAAVGRRLCERMAHDEGDRDAAENLERCGGQFGVAVSLREDEERRHGADGASRRDAAPRAAHQRVEGNDEERQEGRERHAADGGNRTDEDRKRRRDDRLRSRKASLIGKARTPRQAA